MDAAAGTKPSTALRWCVALTFFLAAYFLAVHLLAPAPRRLDAIHALALLIASLSAYAWILYPKTGAALLNLAALPGLAWAWGVGRQGSLGLTLFGFVALWAIAAVGRRGQFRRLHRMVQHLDDLKEELRVKEQALEHAAQTQEGLQKKLSRYTQLQGIAEELSNLTDLAAIAKLAVERAFELIGKSDAALLFLLDAERQELSLFASQKREGLRAIPTKHGDQFDQHVLRSHKPLLVSDVRKDFRFTASGGGERRISSVVACPLVVGQSPAGLLRLDSATAGAYTQDDLRFLDILLDLAATAITNAKLFEQVQQLAMTDGLTGLMLRRPFLELLTRELARSARSREPVSVLMIDIDRFKSLNDTFGHTAGDMVLREVAAVLKAAVRRPGEAAGRYGGEEFVVLLPRVARPQAADAAEKIRRAIETQVKGPRAGGAITASIGLASFPDDAKVELELIRAADGRLYQAKKAGRNQVCGG